MKYWVMKGNPRENNWDDFLQPRQNGNWGTKRPPKDWAAGDRIFCWESKPFKRVVGLAQLINPNLGEDAEGRKRFGVCFLTKRFTYMPDIHELRRVRGLEGALFLQSGPAVTVLPVADSHAKRLFSVLCKGNPAIKKIWPDLVRAEKPVLLPDLDSALFATEGGKHWVSHLLRERNRSLVAAKKKQVLANCGHLECAVCRFDFAKTYGKLGENFCEVHHLKPLSASDNTMRTTLADLAIVCSNCHRMLHQSPDPLSIDKLRQSLQRQLPIRTRKSN